MKSPGVIWLFWGSGGGGGTFDPPKQTDIVNLTTEQGFNNLELFSPSGAKSSN